MKNKKPTNEIIPILASQFDTIKSILIGAGIVLDTIEPKIDEYSFTTKNDVKKKKWDNPVLLVPNILQKLTIILH